MEHKSDVYTNCNGALGTVNKGWKKGTGGLGNKNNERRPSRQLHYWDWSEYWEESRRLEETCCHSKSSVRYYLPTPPLGQDMTQGQFLSGV